MRILPTNRQYKEYGLTPDQIKVISFNVLFPERSFFNLLLTSPFRRYEYQLEVLFPELVDDNNQFSIICLQEVTVDYIQSIERRLSGLEGYTYSPPDKKMLDSHFPIILTKLDFDVIYNRDRVVI